MIALHVNNDFTGSTRVFGSVVESVNFNKIWTNGKEGFLKCNDRVTCLKFNFGKWNFLFVNLIVFLLALLKKKEDIYYCSTSLAFGLGLAGWMKGARVVLHKHEVGLGSATLYRILSIVWRVVSPDVIAVSNYCLHGGFTLRSVRTKILYNPNPYSFQDLTITNFVKSTKEFRVIMPSSCKEYKGVNMFIDLARRMPHIKFILALSDIDKGVLDSDYISLPNLSVYKQPENLDELYSISHVIVNLSNPAKWIETFGMTLIEGMSFGCIPIAPNIGGPIEIIHKGMNGFLIEEFSISGYYECIELLRSNEKLRYRLSMNAKQDTLQYSLSEFKKALNDFLTQ